MFSSATITGKPDIYDVVCVGGGPVGLSFVSALQSHEATRDLKIALIDSQDLSKSTLHNDEKVDDWVGFNPYDW